MTLKPNNAIEKEGLSKRTTSKKGPPAARGALHRMRSAGPFKKMSFHKMFGACRAANALAGCTDGESCLTMSLVEIFLRDEEPSPRIRPTTAGFAARHAPTKKDP